MVTFEWKRASPWVVRLRSSCGTSTRCTLRRGSRSLQRRQPCSRFLYGRGGDVAVVPMGLNVNATSEKTFTFFRADAA